MGREPFRSFSGALYEQPGVNLVVDEGRSYVRRSREAYDVIQATMVDTWAATSAGAFALIENHLYTVEAFKDYLARLAPDGLLSMTRWHLEPPDQLLRLVSLSRAALADLGLERPERRIVVVRGPWQRRFRRAPATFLLKNGEFRDEELERLGALSAEHGFELLYSHRAHTDNLFAALARAPQPERVWRSHESDISPTRDNNPFFFNSVRLRHLARAVSGRAGEWHKTNLGTFVLFALLAVALLATLLFILGPLLLVRRRINPLPLRLRLSWLLYFACLGVGFILVEVVLIQKCILFLGHPVFALTVVLFALLLSSGIGSFLSGRLAEAALPRALPRLLLGVAALVVAYVAALSPLFYALVHLPRVARISLTVLLLVPAGLLLGTPLPVAVRLLAQQAPGLIPWAWGVNGAASVVGSVGALVLALLSGFDQALLAAAGCYVLALVFSRRALPAKKESGAAP